MTTTNMANMAKICLTHPWQKIGLTHPWQKIRFTGDVYLGLNVCQSPLKFDFKSKMGLIEYF